MTWWVRCWHWYNNFKSNHDLSLVDVIFIRFIPFRLRVVLCACVFTNIISYVCPGFFSCIFSHLTWDIINWHDITCATFGTARWIPVNDDTDMINIGEIDNQPISITDSSLHSRRKNTIYKYSRHPSVSRDNGCLPRLRRRHKPGQELWRSCVAQSWESPSRLH